MHSNLTSYNAQEKNIHLQQTNVIEVQLDVKS